MLGLPKLSFDPVLFLPLWLGTFRDASSLGNHAVNTGCHWAARGGLDYLGFSSTDRLSILDSAELNPMQLSVFLWGNFDHYQINGRWYSKRDAGGTHIEIYPASSTDISMFDGVSSPDFQTVNWIGSRSIGISVANGARGNLYLDGTWAKEANANIALTADDAPLLIGNRYDGALPSDADLVGVVACDGLLDANDFAQLHAYSRSLITPRRQWPGSGLRYPGRINNLVNDWDMKKPGTSDWLEVFDPVVTKVPGPYLRVAYSGTDQPGVYQDILSAGERFRFSGRVRSDGDGTITVRDGVGQLAWTSSTSTDWQEIDTKGVVGQGWMVAILQAGKTGYFEIETLIAEPLPSVYTPATGDPTYLDNLQTARVSVGDETSGKLSNTGMDIVTGTWRVSEDAIGRYYNCVGNGQIRRRLLGADAMVTRLFTKEGSATLTKTATAIEIDALATDKIRAVQLEAA